MERRGVTASEGGLEDFVAVGGMCLMRGGNRGKKSGGEWPVGLEIAMKGFLIFFGVGNFYILLLVVQSKIALEPTYNPPPRRFERNICTRHIFDFPILKHIIYSPPNYFPLSCCCPQILYKAYKCFTTRHVPLS